jgi:polyhydroxyalkanoate synthesis regulator phasin
MAPTKMAKQMIDFHKATFDNSFNAMVMLQEQAERLVKISLEQATWLPEEGKRVIDEWLKTYKKGRDDFRKLVDEHSHRVEAFFAEAEKAEDSADK